MPEQVGRLRIESTVPLIRRLCGEQLASMRTEHLGLADERLRAPRVSAGSTAASIRSAPSRQSIKLRGSIRSTAAMLSPPNAAALLIRSGHVRSDSAATTREPPAPRVTGCRRRRTSSSSSSYRGGRERLAATLQLAWPGGPPWERLVGSVAHATAAADSRAKVHSTSSVVSGPSSSASRASRYPAAVHCCRSPARDRSRNSNPTTSSAEPYGRTGSYRPRGARSVTG